MTDVDHDLPSPAAPGSPAETPSGEADPSLEARLRRLDRIVANLEGGEVELEAGLALFEEGVRHIREAEALLARAELRVEELVGGEGETRTRAFGGEAAEEPRGGRE
jgi:exodeoxyribonuclease VII small subunit